MCEGISGYISYRYRYTDIYTHTHTHTHTYTHTHTHINGELTLKFLMLYYCLADFLIWTFQQSLKVSVSKTILKLLYPQLLFWTALFLLTMLPLPPYLLLIPGFILAMFLFCFVLLCQTHATNLQNTAVPCLFWPAPSFYLYGAASNNRCLYQILLFLK